MNGKLVTNGRIRVLCVDDHPVVRSGIQQVIDSQDDMVVVAAAANGEEAVQLFQNHRPDITLMDLQLPGISGIDAIRSIRNEFPKARIIVLTMYQGDEDIGRALDAGAHAYLLKDTLSHDLIRTVRNVHRGEHPISGSVSEGLERRVQMSHLTPREVQIVELIAEGMRDKEIAGALAIAVGTVHAHVNSIFAKLKVSDRTAAITVALRRGIIHLR
jgi:two-component system, NarL family, response regulator